MLSSSLPFLPPIFYQIWKKKIVVISYFLPNLDKKIVSSGEKLHPLHLPFFFFFFSIFYNNKTIENYIFPSLFLPSFLSSHFHSTKHGFIGVPLLGLVGMAYKTSFTYLWPIFSSLLRTCMHKN